jgi:predicted extracellular nuclease
MRMIIFPFLLLATSGCTTAPGRTDAIASVDEITTEAKGPGPGTIVFYNVENLFDTKDDPAINDEEFLPSGAMKWTDERYQRKLTQLATAISLAGPELPWVIGVCEVENRQVVEDLANTPPLDKGHYKIVHHDSPDERGIDVALLVSERFGEVIDDHAITVALNGDHTRDILQVDVRSKGAGDLHFFVNHWPSRREGQSESAPKRMIAAKALRSAVDQVRKKEPNAAIVVMGDLNDEPSDASVTEGLGAATLSEDGAKADLYDLVASDRTEPRGSISFDSKWQYFDHLIVSRSLIEPAKRGALKAVSAASIKDARLIFHHSKYGDQPNRTFSGRDKYHPNGYSDHLPVVLQLK